jgi:hypothetical protein
MSVTACGHRDRPIRGSHSRADSYIIDLIVFALFLMLNSTVTTQNIWTVVQNLVPSLCFTFHAPLDPKRPSICSIFESRVTFSVDCAFSIRGLPDALMS